MGADARLAGSGHRQGEWGLLKRMREGDPWIERGYSGAGAMAVGGEFDGRVIGIVVADYVHGDAKAAWMLPTETILTYLPRIEEFTGGDRNDELGPSRGELPGDVLGDPLRLALTQELTRLLDSGWCGTVVVGTGGTTAVGDSWLVRLVRTADPAARATVSDAELTGAPGDTVLGLGTIDAAYDARGRSAADLAGYLTRRFGLPGGDPARWRGNCCAAGRPPAWWWPASTGPRTRRRSSGSCWGSWPAGPGRAACAWSSASRASHRPAWPTTCRSTRNRCAGTPPAP